MPGGRAEEGDKRWQQADEWKADEWKAGDSEAWKPDEQFQSTDPVVQGEIWGVEGQGEVDGDSVGALPTPAPSQPQARPPAQKILTPDELRELQKHPGVIPLVCGLRGLSFCASGFVGGCIFGGFSAVMEGSNLGITKQPGFARAVMASSASSGVAMAAWIGVYSSGKCMAQLYRGKTDVVNTFVAAFAASLVTTARTRNPRLMLTNGIMHAAMFSAMDLAMGGLPA